MDILSNPLVSFNAACWARGRPHNIKTKAVIRHLQSIAKLREERDRLDSSIDAEEQQLRQVVNEIEEIQKGE